MTIARRVAKVGIGMTQDQMKRLLGPPWNGNGIIATSGPEAVWGYSLATLAENILTNDGRKSALGFWPAFAGIDGRTIQPKITFMNGLVSKIER